ncbi:GNAT family N-acetyltransferase [Ferdinandcohnia sp. Marseille-Q9671]
MKIRKLIPEEAHAYWELRLKALKTEPNAFLVTYEEEKEKENPIRQYEKSFQSVDFQTLGAFEDGSLIGTVTLIRETRAKIRHRANIVAMYVDELHRGKGVAKALLEEAIKKLTNSYTIIAFTQLI